MKDLEAFKRESGLEKKHYRSPVLVGYGPVKKLTAGGTGNKQEPGPDDPADPQPKFKFP